MPVYTVTHVNDQSREYTDKFGPKKSWKMTLKDSAGAESTNVEWSRKPDSPGPTVGQELEGDIRTETIDTRNGPMQVRKFKKAQTGGGGGGGGFRPRDPRETAAIQRQHSQEMAVRVAASAGWFNVVGGFDPKQQSGQGVLNNLARLSDWFQRDIERGVNLAMYGSKEEKRKEPVRTGISDVPGNPDDFEHPRQTGMPDDLPIA
jgi:hypothetical protein